MIFVIKITCVFYIKLLKSSNFYTEIRILLLFTCLLLWVFLRQHIDSWFIYSYEYYIYCELYDSQDSGTYHYTPNGHMLFGYSLHFNNKGKINTMDRFKTWHFFVSFFFLFTYFVLFGFHFPFIFTLNVFL